MAQRASNPGLTDIDGFAKFFADVGGLLEKAAGLVGSISKKYHVGIKSADGLTYEAIVNPNKKQVVEINQLLGNRWIYEVDAYQP